MPFKKCQEYDTTRGVEWLQTKYVTHLRIFGCIAYAQVPKTERKKLDDRGERCIFIGYSEESKAYKLYNPLTNKVVMSRDVIFKEEESQGWNDDITSKEKALELER